MMVQYIPTVRSRAPAGVRVRHEHPTHHKILVLHHEHLVLNHVPYIVRMELLRTLRARDVDTALRDLDTEIHTQAVKAGPVVAC